MTPEEAMEYLHDIAYAYLDYLPVADTTKADIKRALNLGISALKTIADMEGEAHD